MELHGNNAAGTKKTTPQYQSLDSRERGKLRLDDHEYTLFGDTVDELSGWYCFTEQYNVDQERWRQQAEVNPILSQPYENPFKGVGRNDPCPCGSGKKFKKCCLQ
jgi:uncharacterized protein YecA (UPF0149 family)